jgi:hypothetical protein
MGDRRKNSRGQYRKFIKEVGILSYLKNKDIGYNMHGEEA